MSIEYMNAVWKLNLEPTVKFVFITLADCCDHQGSCFPGFNYISKKTCLSRRSVIRAIEQLEKEGYISKEKQIRENGSDSTNRYSIINVLQGATQTPPGATQTPPECHTDTPYNHHLDPPLETKTKTLPEKQKNVAIAPCVFEELFNSLYNNYPSVGKKAPKKAMAALLKVDLLKSTPELILSRLEAQKKEKDLHAKVGLFCPRMPDITTWINGERWNDSVLSDSEVRNLARQQAKMTGKINNDIEDLYQRPSRMNGNARP